MKKYLGYLNSITDKEGLVFEKELGEWVPPTETEIPPSLVSSAYYYYDLTLIIIVQYWVNLPIQKNLLKKPEVKSAFNKRYFNTSTNNFIGRQGSKCISFGIWFSPK